MRKKTKNNILTKALLGIIMVSGSAYANSEGVEIPMVLQCFDYNASHALEEGFGEIPFVQGNGDINMGNKKSAPIEMTLHVNPDNKSWTIMYELGDNLHCVAAGGEGTFRPAGIEPDGIKM
jgi:hypothetical protein